MELRPEQSSDWSNVGGRWLLSRKMHKVGLVEDVPRTVPVLETQRQAQLRQASLKTRIASALELDRRPNLVPFANRVMLRLQHAIAASPGQSLDLVCERKLREWWQASEEERPLFNKLIRAFAAG
jgi:hypothetical protein